MADLTSRFGFNKFGGSTGGTIADDGGKYTLFDRDLLDQLLSQVEQHTHRVPSLPEAPEGDLSLAVVSDSGDLDPGTYFYTFTVVDADGMESLPAAEVEVSTPLPLDPPDEVGAWVDYEAEGDLPGGTYYYALTALRGAEESVLGELTQVAIEPPAGVVVLDLPDYGEATEFRVWRQEIGDPGWTVVGVASSPATQFVDDGSVPSDPCGELPPRFFESQVGYGISVALPAEVDLSTASAWRLYRTDVEGQYDSASLVHEVVEREDEFDDTSPLLRLWLDEGDDLQPGMPPTIDRNMRFQPLTFERADALPDPAGYPLDYPILVDEALYVRVASGWSMVAGGGVGMSSTLTAPDGSRWLLSVDELGALTTAPTAFPGPPSPPTNVEVSDGAS